LVAILPSIIVMARIFWPDMLFDSVSLYLTLIVVVALLIPDVGDIVSRIKKIKKGDIEIELEELVKRTEIVEGEVELTEPAILNEHEDYMKTVTNFVNDPRGGLVAIAVEIESRIRKLATSYSGINYRYTSPTKALDELAKLKAIPNQLPSLFRDFWTIRNQAIHNLDYNFTSKELYSLLDLGVRILDLLTRKPTDVEGRSR
jgi:hypothetical protein